jgi:hypothetical protein
MSGRCAAITGINRAGNGFNGVRAAEFRCTKAAETGSQACTKHTAKPPKWGFIKDGGSR